MPTVRPYLDCPLVVAYGLGVDSTAMFVEFARRDIRPDLILFADTGGEKPETYQYANIIQPFLAKVGFPSVTTVRYQPKRAVYSTLDCPSWWHQPGGRLLIWLAARRLAASQWWT